MKGVGQGGWNKNKRRFGRSKNQKESFLTVKGSLAPQPREHGRKTRLCLVFFGGGLFRGGSGKFEGTNGPFSPIDRPIRFLNRTNNQQWHNDRTWLNVKPVMELLLSPFVTTSGKGKLLEGISTFLLPSPKSILGGEQKPKWGTNTIFGESVASQRECLGVVFWGRKWRGKSVVPTGAPG